LAVASGSASGTAAGDGPRSTACFSVKSLGASFSFRWGGGVKRPQTLETENFGSATTPACQTPFFPRCKPSSAGAKNSATNLPEKSQRVVFCRTFEISHGPAGPLAVASGSASGTVAGDGPRSTACFSVKSLGASFSFRWGGRVKRPQTLETKNFGSATTPASQTPFSRRHKPSSAGAKNTATDLPEKSQRAVFCRTFEISHGPAEPLAVASG